MSSITAEYYPSESAEKHFWAQTVKPQAAEDVMPPGFPKTLNSSLAWRGVDIETRISEWYDHLSFQDILAIESGLAGFESSKSDLSTISAKTFVLPDDLSHRLRALSSKVYNSLGFQVLHGLDPSKYSPRQNAIIYAGVSAHIFPQRGYVDAANGVLGHVVNVQDGKDSEGPESTAPAFSNIPLSFHTDNCEILSFYNLETAMEGGRTVLSSSWQTYNDLAASRSHVLRTLSEPWVLDTFKSNKLMAPYQARPIQKLDQISPPVLFRFSRYPITGWQRKRNPDLLAPTAAQIEAIDAVHFTATANSIKLPVVRGDMVYVNDMAVFHAREGFRDGNSRRHLLKMYLRDPAQGWSLPPTVESEWKAVYGSDEQRDQREEVWQIDYKRGLEELQFVNG